MRPHPAWPTDVPRPRRRGPTAWQRLVLTAAVAAAVLAAFSARRGQGGLFWLAERGRLLPGDLLGLPRQRRPLAEHAAEHLPNGETPRSPTRNISA